METTPQSARALIEHCRDELSPSAHMQSEDEMIAAAPERYRAINALMESVLAYLLPVATGSRHPG